MDRVDQACAQSVAETERRVDRLLDELPDDEVAALTSPTGMRLLTWLRPERTRVRLAEEVMRLRRLLYGLEPLAAWAEAAGGPDEVLRLAALVRAEAARPGRRGGRADGAAGEDGGRQ